MALRAFRLILRYVILLLIAVYFLTAGVLLATKYWLLPRIDQWRPQIEAALTDALGAPVKIRQLQAEWYGLTPSFEITGLTIEDAKGHEALIVPRVEARLSWRTLTTFEPRFRYIGVDDLALAVLRDQDGKLQVAGFSIDLSEDAQRSDSHEPWFAQEPLRWLLSQGQLSLNRATIVWIDEQRGAPPLQLENVSLSLRNRLLSHRLEGRFDLASHPEQQIEFVLQSDRLKAGLAQLMGNAVDGELYLSAANIEPQALAPWLDVPPVTGRFAARTWVDLSQGRVGQVTVDLAARAAGMEKSEETQMGWQVEQASARVRGPLSALLNDPMYADYVLGVGSNQSLNPVVQPVLLRLQSEGLVLAPPDDVLGAMRLNSLSLRAGLERSSEGNLRLSVQNLSAVTPDGALALNGRWSNSQNDVLGSMDLSGTLSQFDLTQLHRYLPKVVGEDVLAWMQTAFTAGSVPQAAFVARGPLASFPYATPEEGEFTIDGTVNDWTIDYAPSAVTGGLGWPAIQKVDGTLSLNGDLLSVVSQNAGLRVSPEADVTVSRIDATLQNLYSTPLLQVRAKTNSVAANYQTALTKTALADVVPSLVHDLRGEGQWELDLDLTVPLEDVEKVDFKAVLDLNGGALQFASLPPLEQVMGKAVFTDEGFQSDGLNAKLLGSDLTVTGAFGTPGQTLKVQSAIQLEALNSHFKMPSLNQWVKGVLPIDVVMTQAQADGPYIIQAESDLTGVQLAFPAPLTLAAGTPLKTSFQWEVNPSQASAGRGSLRIGNLLQIQATGRESDQGSVLSSVAIGVGTAPRPVADGFTVNIAAKRLSASAWETVAERIMQEIGSTAATGRSVMPEFGTVQLTSNELLYDDRMLNDVTIHLQATQESYAAQFSARQTSGTASWQLRNGSFVGSLNVRLTKLELGEPDAAQTTPAKSKTKLPDAKTLSTIPPLDLIIEDLVLNGVKLGRLQLVGENEASNRRWFVEQLTVTNKNVRLSATGHWSFDHQRPGVLIKADMDVMDLGEALAALGVRDQVRRGRGNIKAQLVWQRFPWEVDFSGLSGKVEVDLTEGIFVNINSGSARVLELLSLQSFGRLLDMNINRGETFSNGFPWSTIDGSLTITDGVINTNDLVVNSPVARIAFLGGANLPQETLDLRATVRPNLDLSGTAMATGFLLNPIVGLSALVGNYLLRNPIENILSLHYEVTGPWADPVLKEVAATQEPISTNTRVPAASSPSENSAQTSSPVGTEATGVAPRENREVYRIELGKDSGFDPAPRR